MRKIPKQTRANEGERAERGLGSDRREEDSSCCSGRRCPAVVLWPGLGSTAESFSRLLREGATRGYLMVAIDPPGQGRSERIPLRGRSDAAAIFLACLDALGVKSAVIGGHSYGAGAALAALVGSPRLRQQTCGVVLYDGGYMPFDESAEELHAECERFLTEYTFASWDDFLASQRKEAPRWDHDMEVAARASMIEREGRIRSRLSVAQCAEAMDLMAGNAPALLPRVELNMALLLRAGQPLDMEKVRLEGTKALQERISGLSVRVLPRASHEILDEDPDGVARETFSFLARVPWG